MVQGHEGSETQLQVGEHLNNILALSGLYGQDVTLNLWGINVGPMSKTVASLELE